MLPSKIVGNCIAHPSLHSFRFQRQCQATLTNNSTLFLSNVRSSRPYSTNRIPFFIHGLQHPPEGQLGFQSTTHSFCIYSNALSFKQHTHSVQRHTFKRYHSLLSTHQRFFHSSKLSFAGAKKNFPPVTPPRLQIFNRQAHHKNRVFASKIENSLPFEYIREEISFNIISRLEYILKDFPSVAEVGCGKGWIYRMLLDGSDPELGDKTLTGQAPESQGMFKRWNMQEYVLMDQCEMNLMDIPDAEGIEVARVLANEERLPLLENSYDLIISGHYLHSINDLEGVFNQIQSALKPDGCFVGAMFGGNTLHELKSCFVWAEHEREGGISPHVSPMVGIRDVGNLMSGAGFNLPTVDSDEIVVYYPDAFTLMKHLQLMGEGNIVTNRRPMISKETLLATAALYDELFYDEKHGGVPATFELVYMIGWKPHQSQPKPKLRGSAEFSLKDFAEEMSTDVQSIHETGQFKVPKSNGEPIIEEDDADESDDETIHR